MPSQTLRWSNRGVRSSDVHFAQIISAWNITGTKTIGTTHIILSVLSHGHWSATSPNQPNFFSFMAHQKHIYDLMKFDSYPRFIRSEHYRRLVEMELTNNYVTENDVTQAYKKGFDTQEDKKRKKSAFKLLKNAVNPIVSNKIKWGAYYRRSFGPNSDWSSRETTTIVENSS